MKQKQMFSAAALASVLGLLAPVANLAASSAVYADSALTGSGTQPDTSSCATESATSTTDQLQSDIDAGGVVCIYGSVELDKSLTISHDVTIVLVDGAELSFNGNDAVIKAYKGKIDIIGTGKIIASGTTSKNNGINIDKAAEVTVGSGITVEAKTVYGIAIFKNTDGSDDSSDAALTLYGTVKAPYGITVNGSIKTSPAKVFIKDGAKIDAGTSAFYAAGDAEWEIGAATLTGTAANGIKSGRLNFTNTTMHVTGEHDAVEEPKVSVGNIAIIYSSVFQIEHNKPAYAGEVKITINGGNYTSDHSTIFTEYGAPDSETAVITVKSGTFTADKEVFRNYDRGASLTVTGGTFTAADLSAFADNYLASGYKMTMTGENTGTVSRIATSSKPTTPDTGTTEDQNTVLETEDGVVSVIGDFGDDKVTLTVEESDMEVAGLEEKNYALFDINLLDAEGVKYNFDGTVTVSIKVPAGINGEKSSIYYVKNDGTLAERLVSIYNNGLITFQTTHFSYYAIVEDGGADAESLIAPSTGVIMKQDPSATITIVPMIAIASGFLASRWYGLTSRRKAQTRAGRSNRK